MSLREGEKLQVKGRTVTVTPLAFESLPKVREYLIQVARQRRTVTYGELRADVGLTYAINGLGWLLDLLSVDCERRGEPPLDALVISAETGEVGQEFGADPEGKRTLVYAHWT